MPTNNGDVVPTNCIVNLDEPLCPSCKEAVKVPPLFDENEICPNCHSTYSLREVIKRTEYKTVLIRVGDF